jgi:hypothetical protein
MPSTIGASRVPVAEYYGEIQDQIKTVNEQFSFYVAAKDFNEEDLREYIYEPISALPPSVSLLLPKIVLLLVPGLIRNGKEKGNGTRAEGRMNGRANDVYVLRERPTDEKAAEAKWAPYVSMRLGERLVIALAVADQEAADYHYHLFRELAILATERIPADRLTEYSALLAEEIHANAHGEVDDESWQLKQSLRRRGSSARPSKALSEYSRVSFIDTLTLYLHGICCDIDVEPGPRQLPSRHLRRRLKMLAGMLPAPKGYAVFPEELDGSQPPSTHREERAEL